MPTKHNLVSRIISIQKNVFSNHLEKLYSHRLVHLLHNVLYGPDEEIFETMK